MNTAPGQMIGTRHPWVFIGIGVAEMGGGVVLFTSPAVHGYSTGFNLAMLVLFIGLGLLTAWPGLWSRRHRAAAAAAADRNWREHADFVREHPAMAFVVMPVLAGGIAAVRAGRLWQHPDAGDRLLLGVGGLLLGVLIQLIIAVVARRRATKNDRARTTTE